VEIAQGTPYASIYPCSGIITPYSLPRSRLQLSRLMVPECSRSLLKRERHDGLGHVFDTEGIHIHIFSPRNGVELISRGAWEKNGSLGIAIHLTQPRKDRRCFATEKNTSPGLAQAFPVSKNIGKQHPRRFPACHTSHNYASTGFLLKWSCREGSNNGRFNGGLHHRPRSQRSQRRTWPSNSAPMAVCLSIPKVAARPPGRGTDLNGWIDGEIDKSMNDNT
jgi:hypothetical protein